MALRINNDLFIVTSHEFCKPGKGGAFARVKLKNVTTGQALEKTLRSSDKFEDVPLDEKKLQHSYESGDDIVFMDLNSYEEVYVSKDIIGDGLKFLQEHLEVIGLADNGKILRIDLPIFIEAEISHTDPGLKGDSSKAGTKPATIDTGATVQVPLFIETGEKVKIDTRTGQYVERVKR